MKGNLRGISCLVIENQQRKNFYVRLQITKGKNDRDDSGTICGKEDSNKFIGDTQEKRGCKMGM